MKETLLLLAALVLSLTGWSQESSQPTTTNIAVKWAPTGLIIGSASLQAEYNFGSRNSLTAKIGLPLNAKHSLTYDGEKIGFNMKATSFLAGYRTYLSKNHLRGFYYEPFFKYVHHTSEGTGTGTLDGRKALFNLMNNYTGTGIGVQLGAQFFIGKHLVVDLFFLGPEINSSSNTFKAAEISNAIPWSSVDAAEAESDIRNFLNQFPFVRNRTKIMMDSEMKRVTADFKGALPGLRTGLSIGFAF